MSTAGNEEVVWNLPNILTVARIALAPVIAVLPFIDGYLPKVIAFAVFLVAAISDYWDGRLARERDEITDLGKLLDPLADKLLLFATMVPIFVLTRESLGAYLLPWWGEFPLWAAILIIGREVFMTVLREYAKRRGVVIAAVGAGKAKTTVQHIFVGTMIAWFAWKDLRAEFNWQSGRFADIWELLHGALASVTLGLAVLLTVYSLAVYLYRYRFLFGGTVPSGGSRDGA